jgi:hypothetical protein
MKRRAFIKTSLAATSLVGLGHIASPTQAAENSGAQEYYEWRTYQLKTSGQKERVDEYLKNAYIPALNRLGCKPIGAFTLRDAQEITGLQVLTPYPSLEVFGAVAAALEKDAAYQKDAAAYLQATKNDPAYTRIESSFMKAFAGMPKIELQPFSTGRKPRMFELRIYEAHSEFKCQKKVEMFNQGELQVMRDTGMGPVFYGQTLIGAKFPNMTYMLSAESKEDHAAHWKAFGAHPEWNRLKALPEYADTVSNITNTFLVPTEYSQI